MNVELGMVVEQAQEHAELVDQRSADLERVALRISQWTRSVTWIGPDATAFDGQAQGARAQLMDLAERCRSTAAALREEAEQQEIVSSPNPALQQVLHDLLDLFGLDGPDASTALGMLDVPYDEPGDDIAPIGEDRITRPGPDAVVEPHSAQDLIQNLQHSADLSSQDAQSIRIQEVRGPDGESRYVVYIPGSFGPEPERIVTGSEDKGGNPFDWNQNIGATNGQSTDSSRAVEAAMQAAGIPPGSDVVLVGHSQGGAVGSNLAGDPAFNGPGGYNVTDVVSIGSPVEATGPLAGTSTINFFHGPTATDSGFRLGDPVPHADEFLLGPIVPNGYEASTDRHEVYLPATHDDPMANHEISAYQSSVEQEITDNPNGTAAEYMSSESMQNVIGPESTVVDTIDVSTSREDGTYEPA